MFSTRYRFSRVRTLSLLLLAAVLVGCSSGSSAPPPPKTVPVSGTVTLNGKPLAMATVMFIPRGSTKGIECSGLTDETGRYQLRHPRGLDGAPAGDYSVAVSHFVDQTGKAIELKPGVAPADLGATESLPARYSSFTETKLTALVPEAGGELNFDLKTK